MRKLHRDTHPGENSSPEVDLTVPHDVAEEGAPYRVAHDLFQMKDSFALSVKGSLAAPALKGEELGGLRDVLGRPDGGE